MNGNEFSTLTQSAFVEGFKEGEIYILEKIKAEIQEEIEDYLMEDDYIMGVKDGFLFSAEIVDMYIKKLKG